MNKTTITNTDEPSELDIERGMEDAAPVPGPTAALIAAILGDVEKYAQCCVRAAHMEAQPEHEKSAAEALRVLEAKLWLRFGGYVVSSCAECGKTHGDGWALYCVDCCIDIRNLVSPSMPPDMAGLIQTLNIQRQVDEDGTLVGVSRQALDQAVKLLAGFAATQKSAPMSAVEARQQRLAETVDTSNIGFDCGECQSITDGCRGKCMKAAA